MTRPSVDLHYPSASRPAEGLPSSIDAESGPVLTAAEVTGVVLYCHGGKPEGTYPPSEKALSLIRLRAFESFARADLHRRGVATWFLRYRNAGWNGTSADPARDAEWALAEIARQHGPQSPVVLIGHSMGGRAVLRVGGAASVRAICALAPWIGPGEPHQQLDRAPLVVLAHGRGDRWTSPRASLAFAEQLKHRNPRVARFELPGGHSMVRAAARWHHLTLAVALGGLGHEPLPAELTNALQQAPPAGLRAPW